MCGFCGIFRNCCRREEHRPFPCFVPVKMCVHRNPEFEECERNRCCCCWERERKCGCENNWENRDCCREHENKCECRENWERENRCECRENWEHENKCGCRENWIHENRCAKRENWGHEKDCDW